MRLSTYFVLARVAAARTNFERARTVLEQAENQGVTRAGEGSRPAR